MKHLVTSLFLMLLLAAAPEPSRAQNGPPAPPPAAGAEDGSAGERVEAGEDEDGPSLALDPAALPVDINRIQRRLARTPLIRPEDARPVFRVEVFGRNPTIDEILGPNWRRGPVPASGMTHQEFLNMVTPRDVQGYAAFDNRQAMTVAATSFALQWALRQALRKLDDATTARQKEAARREVDEALAALQKARREAGLPQR